jgi:hypothetical protein
LHQGHGLVGRALLLTLSGIVHRPPVCPRRAER